MNRCLVLLTFNEIDAIRQLFDSIPKNYDEFFVIDPGSQDGTIEFFREKGITVNIQERRGRGAAFIMASNISKCDNIVFYSPDGNEDPKDIDKLFMALESGADLAIASRFMKDSRNEEDDKLLRFRKWTNQCFTLLVNIAFSRKGAYVTDTINGFRGFNRKKMIELELNELGFAIEFQSTIRALKKKYVIKEFPTIEGDRIGGASKAPSIPTGILFIKLYLKELLSFYFS